MDQKTGVIQDLGHLAENSALLDYQIQRLVVLIHDVSDGDIRERLVGIMDDAIGEDSAIKTISEELMSLAVIFHGIAHSVEEMLTASGVEEQGEFLSPEEIDPALTRLIEKKFGKLPEES